MKRLLPGILATCALVGCDSKIKECNDLSTIVNDTVSKTQALEARMMADDPAEVGKAAGEFADLADGAAEKIGALEIKTEGLKAHADDYRKMMVDIAAATRAFAGEMKEVGDVNGDALTKAEKDAETAQGELEKACEADSPDCQKVTAAMQKMPQDAKEEEMVKHYDQIAAELKGLALETDPVKTARDGYVKALEAYAGHLKKSEDLIKKVETREKEIDEVASREEKLVDSINTFCGAT